MKIRSSPMIPTLLCPGVPLNGMQAGLVIGIIDSDSSDLHQLSHSGRRWHALLRANGCSPQTQQECAIVQPAFESGRSVMVMGESTAI